MALSRIELGKRLIVIAGLLGCAALAAYPTWQYEVVRTTSLSFSGSGKVRLEGAARYYGVTSRAFVPTMDSSRIAMVDRAPLWSPPARAASFTTTSDTMMLGDDPVVTTTTHREYQEPARLEIARLLTAWVVIAGIAGALVVTLGVIDARIGIRATEPRPPW